MAQSKQERAAYQKKYRAENKAKRREYLLKNKEKIATRARERALEKYYRDKEVKDFIPEYSAISKSTRSKAQKEWRKRNPEKVKEWKRNYYHKNREKILADRKNKKS